MDESRDRHLLGPFLYHGTSQKYLKRIQEEGLLPGAGPGTMGDGWPTRPGYVYLTQSNIVNYMVVAYHSLGLEGIATPMAGVRVDTDYLNSELLYPDDEFLAYLLGLAEDAYKLHGVDPRCDPVQHQDLWMDSLAIMHSVAYAAPIPREAIRDFIEVTQLAAISGDYLKINTRASVHQAEHFGQLNIALCEYLFDGNEEQMTSALVTSLRRTAPDHEDPETEAVRTLRRIIRRSHYVRSIPNEYYVPRHPS